MDVIDDEANLFGVVNVVDALVVLLVLAVVAAGAALVLGGDGEEPPEPEVRYATVDLGTQQSYVANLIESGDRMGYGGGESLIVTDVYVTDHGNDKRVLARVELESPATENSEFTFDGNPPRVGRQLSISTNEYSTSGRITSVSESDPTLALVNRTVLLEGTLSIEEAERLSTNDSVVRGNQTIASVDSFQLYGTDNPNERRVIVAVDLLAHRDGDRPQFGSTPLRLGESVQLNTEEYSLSGSILRIGVGELPISERDVLLRTGMSADEASALSVGDEYEVNGQTVATVQSVDAYGTGNPERRLVYVGVSYVTYEPRAEPQFAGQVVREGAQLPFRTDEYEFEGRVVRENALEQRGEETTRTVTLEIESAQPDVANSLEAGMAERVNGETIAGLSNVSVEPADIVLTSDDGNVYLREHPVEKDVAITADLQVRESINGVTFKGESIRAGDTVLIDLGTVTIRATVTSL
ncbi:DUF4330 family protein [Halorubellus sp. JP-L1]|uniref:DUF4330 domain-containing protein n=1 Tax=Halorubellus sp. JP-L1 TaxID=2715753 RepID=UPI00140C7122|nr:DUF4330 domain-containing protein [Halorubellus sp. JP-L1]NHN40964.1 DUF4330 family protein [Halorubellus sp. JP-L1]